MYRPVATALSSTPERNTAQRSQSACGTGMPPRIRSTVEPITTTLATVPRPGRWRSGIHSSSTNTLARISTVPTGMPVRPAIPVWKTSQGSTPTAGASISASLTP